MLTVRIASDPEINELLDIYVEKIKWLRANDKAMWDESQVTLENLKKKYDNPVYYIGIVNGKIIGGFILIEIDQIWWPENKDEAFYFHKFVVKNEYCGKGYADEMIKWVLRYGKEKNKKFVRLDYDGNRKYIQDLYTRNGFIPVETSQNENVRNLIKAEFAIEGDK